LWHSTYEELLMVMELLEKSVSSIGNIAKIFAKSFG